VGAYGGRAEIMKQVMPSGPVFQAGTLSGNPVAMAAGIATLRELKAKPPYARFEQLGKRLAGGLKEAARSLGLPAQVNQVGSMWTLFFTGTEVVDFASAKTADTKRFARFFWEMMDRGYYLPCSQFEAAFLSVPMTEAHIDQTIAAAHESLAVIAGGS
jgi:glutamate-1-semialdehyde 2,1-aminomutase